MIMRRLIVRDLATPDPRRQQRVPATSVRGNWQGGGEGEGVLNLSLRSVPARRSRCETPRRSRAPWTSHTRSFVRPLLKNRREGEQLALRQSARTYRRKSSCVVRYLTTLSAPRRAPQCPACCCCCCPVSNVSPPSLHLSLLLCFCDLFVSASRSIYNFFSFFSAPVYLSPPSSSKEGVVGLARHALPRTRNCRCISSRADFSLLREKGEAKRERNDNGRVAPAHACPPFVNVIRAGKRHAG